MLAGVELHPLKPCVPVDLTRNLCTDFQRRSAVVDDLAVPFVRVRHADAAEQAGVARLSAAFGVKACPVEHDVEAVFARRAGGHAGRERPHVRIFVIKPFRHDPLSLFFRLSFSVS